jgi:hypothetical protein
MMQKIKYFIMLSLFLLLLFATSAYSADWYVATNADGTTGGDWSHAYTNIQQALTDAGDNDNIYLAGHTFLITNQLIWADCKNVHISGSYAATNGSPGTNNFDYWPTVIKPAAGVTSRIWKIENVTNASLSRVKITQGLVITNTNHRAAYGAGIYLNNSSDITLNTCTIQSNMCVGKGTYSDTVGVGIFVGGNGVLTLTNCNISGNKGNVRYGDVHRGGGIAVYGRAHIYNTVFKQNFVTRGGLNNYTTGGGAIYANGNVDVFNCLFNRNGKDGIYCDAGTISLINCTLVNHYAAAIYNAGASVSVTNSIIWWNADDISGSVDLAYCDIQDGDSNGINGCTNIYPEFEYGYYLAVTSPCVNAGSTAASDLGLDQLTTRADGQLDTGTVDMGYHYREGADLTYADIYVDVNTGNDGNSGTNSSQPLKTINKALELCTDGTRIHVSTGNYTYATESFPLIFKDKVGIQLLGSGRSSTGTVIDASSSTQRVVYVNESANLLLQNVRITGGCPESHINHTVKYGGGICVSNSLSVILQHCSVVSNSSLTTAIYGDAVGGGIFVASDSSITVTNCIVSGNTAELTSGDVYYGGGIAVKGKAYLYNSVLQNNFIIKGSPIGNGGGIHCNGLAELQNCVLTDNGNDGIYFLNGNLNIMNCTVANNGEKGVCYSSGSIDISNSIIYGHNDDLFNFPTNSQGVLTNVSYSCIGNGDNAGSKGCFSLNPEFVDTNYYHLKSTISNYTDGWFEDGTWDTSSAHSPCIDNGDPAAVYTNEPLPNGSNINVGAYGNTHVASLSNPNIEKPGITNISYNSLGHNKVTVNGAVTNTGGVTPWCRLKYWSAGSVSTSTVLIGLHDSAYSYNITGLDIGTDYHYYFTASNSAGIGVSTEKSFSTLPPGADLYVSANGNNTAATNWTTAYTNLQTAFNIVADSDTVYLAQGHYTRRIQYAETNVFELQNVNNVSIFGGYKAESSINLPGERDTDLYKSVLFLTAGDIGRVWYVSNVETGLVDGLTVSSGVLCGKGIGIRAENCNKLQFADCIFSNNKCEESGATKGGSLYQNGGTITLTNCCIISNSCTGGHYTQYQYGSGVYVGSGILNIVDSFFFDNVAIGWYGGSSIDACAKGACIYINTGASAFIKRTVLKNNYVNTLGAMIEGIAIYNSGNCELLNCLIADNISDDSRFTGTIHSEGTISLQNCTVADNDRRGLYYSNGVFSVTNSIIYGNGDDLTNFPSAAGGTISNLYYSLIGNGDNAGTNGCITGDPLFVDTNYYHLQSVRGNYTNGYFSGGGWGESISNSPCIDAADPQADCSLEPSPNGNRLNMGAYGNTSKASLSKSAPMVFSVH